MLRRALGLPGGGSAPVYANDAFTDTAGVALQSHTPSGGGSWAKHPTSSGDLSISDANRLRSTTGTNIYTHSWTPITADYEVSADLVCITNNASSQAGVALRIDPTANTLYAGMYNTASGLFSITRVLAGTSSVRASAAATITAGDVRAIRLRARGTLLELFVNNEFLLSVTDTNIAAAGSAGVRFLGTGSNSVGLHLDAFAVRG